MGIEISRLKVTRNLLVRATPARVWEEFTSFDRLAAWFGRGHTLEAFERLGAAAADNLQGFEEGWDAKHLIALRGIVEA